MSLFPDEECPGRPDDYHKQIRRCIRRCLKRRPHQLIELVRACAGAYPTIVIQCLQELGTEIRTNSLEAFASLAQTESEGTDGSILFSIESNPVLSSWYFTTETCERIGRLRDWGQKRLAFLGTPRLYEWFRQNGLGNNRVLLDLDPIVTEKLSILYEGDRDLIESYDVSNAIPQSFRDSFDCVFFDPPWYPNDYLVWLKRATELAPGGSVFFSLFPVLTRPAADLERHLLLSKTREVSFVLTLLSSFAEYVIPTFEAAQLEASGVSDLGPWKIADFVVVELRPEAAVELQIGAAPIRWKEVDIDSLRIFVNPSMRFENGTSLLIPGGTSTVLSSPSRRNPTLKNINVLTSRGHGLIASRPDELLRVLNGIRMGHLLGRPLELTIDRLGLDAITKDILVDTLKGVANA